MERAKAWLRNNILMTVTKHIHTLLLTDTANQNLMNPCRRRRRRRCFRRMHTFIDLRDHIKRKPKSESQRNMLFRFFIISLRIRHNTPIGHCTIMIWWHGCDVWVNCEIELAKWNRHHWFASALEAMLFRYSNQTDKKKFK